MFAMMVLNKGRSIQQQNQQQQVKRDSSWSPPRIHKVVDVDSFDTSFESAASDTIRVTNVRTTSEEEDSDPSTRLVCLELPPDGPYSTERILNHTLCNRGQLYFACSKLNESFTSENSIASTHISLVHAQAYEYWEQNRIDAAIQVYQKCLTRGECQACDQEMVFRQLARLCLADRRYRKARAYAQKAASRATKRLLADADLGLVAFATNKLSKADQYWMGTDNRQNSILLNNRALVKVAQGSIADARGMLQLAVEQMHQTNIPNQQCSTIHQNLVQICQQLGEPAWWQRTVQHTCETLPTQQDIWHEPEQDSITTQDDPEQMAPFLILGPLITNRTTKKKASIERMVREAVLLFMNYPHQYDKDSWQYHVYDNCLERIPAAIDECRHLLEHGDNQHNGAIWYALGMIYLVSNNNLNEAIEALGWSHKLSPSQRPQLALALAHIANCDTAKAEEILEHVYEEHQSTREHWYRPSLSWANLHNTLCVLQYLRGDEQRSLRSIQAACDHLGRWLNRKQDSVGDKHKVEKVLAIMLQNKAFVQIDLGEYAEAQESYKEAGLLISRHLSSSEYDKSTETMLANIRRNLEVLDKRAGYQGSFCSVNRISWIMDIFLCGQTDHSTEL